jgi:DMSO/TMAO reductase YedYZ molybdopterin-dependent catalytic subunit
MVTRGFTGRQAALDNSERIPPGQHLVSNFPVLSAGATPRVATEDWQFTLKVGPRSVKTWSWAEFNALPQTRMTRTFTASPRGRSSTPHGRVSPSMTFSSMRDD